MAYADKRNLTTPQEDRKDLILKSARAINHTRNCSILQKTIEQLEIAVNDQDCLKAINLIIDALLYETGEETTTVTRIKALKIEFQAYTSLLVATVLKNEEAIAWFRHEMEEGIPTRII